METILSFLPLVLIAAFSNNFQNDISATTGYAGGAIRLKVDASNFDPLPRIGWNYRGKSSIQNSDPRFYVLPNGILQITGLTSNEEGDIRAIAQSQLTGVKTQKTMTGKFAKLTVAAGNDC